MTQHQSIRSLTPGDHVILDGQRATIHHAALLDGGNFGWLVEYSHGDTLDDTLTGARGDHLQVLPGDALVVTWDAYAPDPRIATLADAIRDAIAGEGSTVPTPRALHAAALTALLLHGGLDPEDPTAHIPDNL